jgi:hypothetical protein
MTMKGLWKNSWRAGIVLLAASTAALAQTNMNTGQNGDTREMASPGAVNYIEGQVTLDGQPLAAHSAGSTVVGLNQPLSTADGYAEVLLTPGAFLRIGHNSQVRLLSAGLAGVQMQLDRGEAMVEVADLVKGSRLDVAMGNAATRIEKTGLYDFDANQHAVRVLDGEAAVTEGARTTKLKKHDQVLLASDKPLKKRSFDPKPAEAEPLYVWSKVRSEAESEENVHMANTIAAGGGWNGAGWYWDPMWGDYAFMPAWGMFGGPFGFGYYSPGVVIGSPWGYGGYGFRGHRGWDHDHDGDWHRGYHGGGWHGGSWRGGDHGGVHAGAFHGGYRGGRVGGFHGAGGGFHGAGGGSHGAAGGFHGGGASRGGGARR